MVNPKGTEAVLLFESQRRTEATSCPVCGSPVHIYDSGSVTLRNMPIYPSFTASRHVRKIRLRRPCPYSPRIPGSSRRNPSGPHNSSPAAANRCSSGSWPADLSGSDTRSHDRNLPPRHIPAGSPRRSPRPRKDVFCMSKSIFA